MHRKKHSCEKIKKAFAASQGRVTETAKKLKVTPQTVYNWLNENEELRTYLEGIREIVLDLAEARLSEAVERGDEWAIKFVLLALGKHRGWAYGKPRTRTDSTPEDFEQFTNSNPSEI